MASRQAHRLPRPRNRLRRPVHHQQPQINSALRHLQYYQHFPRMAYHNPILAGARSFPKYPRSKSMTELPEKPGAPELACLCPLLRVLCAPNMCLIFGGLLLCDTRALRYLAKHASYCWHDSREKADEKRSVIFHINELSTLSLGIGLRFGRTHCRGSRCRRARTTWK